MKKIMSISHDDYQCECLYEEGAVNPYRLYKREWKRNKNGYPYKSKTLIHKYADLKSVLVHIAIYGV